jgi:signal transduction histidine kinase
VFGVVGTVEMVVQAYRPLPVSIGTYWLACLTLCARRSFPLATPLVTAVMFVLAASLGFDVSRPASWILPPALACFSAGLNVPRSRAVASFGSVACTLAIVYLTLATLTHFNPDIIFGLLFTIGPWAVGLALREALDRNRELAADAERARLERTFAVEQAAAAERRRISRELHDVLAHSLSVMVVQASLAEDLVGADPASASTAMREVQQSGRNALAETSRLLRLIRDDENELGLQPQRAISDLPELANEYARAGLDVDLQIDSAPAGLPVGIELSAYRIVQEALTNALKHAPGSCVDVRLSRVGNELAINVHNGPSTGAPVANGDGGHGLVGMRERVSLFGGTLRTSRADDGGFVLAVTLPTPLGTS